MAPPPRGHFVLHSNVLPPVTAGRYVLESGQSGTPFGVDTEQTHVTVSSPRYTMPPDQILSTFPPANGDGAFGDRLPQVVLKRRTLPWERNPLGAPTVSTTPWLALVVVAEGEAELSAPTPVEGCVTAGTPLLDPSDRDVVQGVYLAVTETVVRKIFPTQEDLPLLVHVREVDVQDTELAAGDDDGWAAVVLANRLPVFDTAANKPVRYLACLVNVEGQLPALPSPVQPRDFFEYEVAQDWTVLASSISHADQMVTGIGATALPIEALHHAAPAAPAAFAAAKELPGIGAALDGTSVVRDVAAATRWETGPAKEVAAAALDADAPRRVRDTMASGWRLPIEAFALEKVLRFPVLAHWSFTTSEGATFETLMQDLDVGLLGTLPEPDPADPPAPAGPEVAGSGHVALDHQTRRGDAAEAWYRGPLVPHPTDRDEATPSHPLEVAHAADQLRRVVPDGREDLSLAAAYEIGRLLALSQLSIVSALLRFRQEQFGVGRVRELVGPLLPDGIKGALDDPYLVSHGIGLGLFETLAENPVAFAGPPRPVADPGRPVEVGGALDAVVAAGLGLDLATLQATADTVGMAAALAATDVPLAAFDEKPQTDDRALASLRDTLHAEVERVAVIAAKGAGPAAPGDVRGAAAEPPRDALDDLLDRGREEALMARATIGLDLVYAAIEEAVLTFQQDLVEDDPDDGAHVVPGELRRFLARLRLLHGVPFSYLVPDQALLPPESIRFFYLDRRWTDALVEGALGVGTITTADRAQIESVYPHVRDDVDQAERVIRTPIGEERLDGAGGAITGLLLRSRTVSGWPGLHVRAYRRDLLPDDALTTEAESNPDRLKVLRLERLAPAVLLVLFDGVPAVVHIEEPRRGVQFGARLDPEDPPAQRRAKVHIRDASTGTLVPPPDDFTPQNSIDVPFRPGAPGVIDMRTLRTRMLQKPVPNVGPTLEPHEYALQMLRFPYRQVFGDPRETEGSKFYDLDGFRVRLALGDLETTLSERLVELPVEDVP